VSNSEIFLNQSIEQVRILLLENLSRKSIQIESETTGSIKVKIPVKVSMSVTTYVAGQVLTFENEGKTKILCSTSATANSVWPDIACLVFGVFVFLFVSNSPLVTIALLVLFLNLAVAYFRAPGRALFVLENAIKTSS
jgi:hypothetical protein